MKIEIQDPENTMNFNAVDKDGRVVAAGVSCRYALSASPRAAKFVTDKEGHVLAVAIGGVAWIPTSRGLGFVTEAAQQLGYEGLCIQYSDPAGAVLTHLARFDRD